MYDAVIIGAGIGGLMNLAEAVAQGFTKILLIDRKPR